MTPRTWVGSSFFSYFNSRDPTRPPANHRRARTGRSSLGPRDCHILTKHPKGSQRVPKGPQRVLRGPQRVPRGFQRDPNSTTSISVLIFGYADFLNFGYPDGSSLDRQSQKIHCFLASKCGALSLVRVFLDIRLETSTTLGGLATAICGYHSY